MRLSGVHITKLFGIFDHSITFKDSGITIIYGENGLGKTIMLEITEAFFSSKFNYLAKVDFESLTFEFSEEKTLKIIKKKETEEKEISTVEIRLIDKLLDSNEPYVLKFRKASVDDIIRKIKMRYPLRRMYASDLWENRQTGERFSSQELIDEYADYSDYLWRDSGESLEQKQPEWFREICEKVHVALIETQRLVTLDRSSPHKTRVESYSKELANEIKSFLSKSTELSSRLDRTYPKRLINILRQEDQISEPDLEDRLSQLEKKRELLDAVGLIGIEKDSDILTSTDIFEQEDIKEQRLLRSVLKLYTDDSFDKIKIFDSISTKIEMLLDIINKRFKHKKLTISKEKGFCLYSTILKKEDGSPEEIPVSSLSSGEQHELILIYSLLFKTDENSLILIDEPEVSLHISWQNSFIKDIQGILKLNNLYALIATHSPDIISDEWDWTVKLKGYSEQSCN